MGPAGQRRASLRHQPSSAVGSHLRHANCSERPSTGPTDQHQRYDHKPDRESPLLSRLLERLCCDRSVRSRADNWTRSARGRALPVNGNRLAALRLFRGTVQVALRAARTLTSDFGLPEANPSAQTVAAGLCEWWNEGHQGGRELRRNRAFRHDSPTVGSLIETDGPSKQRCRAASFRSRVRKI